MSFLDMFWEFAFLEKWTIVHDGMINFSPIGVYLWSFLANTLIGVCKGFYVDDKFLLYFDSNPQELV